MSAKQWGHAIVVGSGMAGLVTARVLSEHFARVTVLERDAAPDGGQPRPGVPQGWHFHGLLAGGLTVLSELLPGLPEELAAAGALRPGPDEFYFFLPQGKSYALGTYLPVPRPDDGKRRIFVQSRALLEACVRRRVAALENVEFRYRARVADIVAEGARVSGVQLEDGSSVRADLVIEAMGRGGRTLQWLDRLGFERPVENVIHCDFAYSSVFMRPRTPDVFQDVGFFVMANKRWRGGALVRLEGGVWLASVGGSHGDYPPDDWQGFLQFAETTGEPFFTQLLAQSDPIANVVQYRFKQSVRRRFEQLERFPEGLLPIGDTICHYNPSYGQGMSAACRQAVALQRILRARRANDDGVDGLWRDFLPEAFQETRAPWLFAALADFRNPSCRGDFPSEEGELIELLISVFSQVSAGDMQAFAVLLAIQGLNAPLETLREPPWPQRLAAAKASQPSG